MVLSSASVTLIKVTDGATGTSVSSITEEYYLSTSKTTQTGGSWTTTPPTWSTGKYIWTRSKIVYANPTSTKYTTPICDSSWEAVNEVQIGGRNLLKDSEKEVGTTSVNEFVKFADIAPIFDKYGLIEYTISFDIKSADITNMNNVNVYCQNGSATKYNIGATPVIVTTEYQRKSITVTPIVADDSETQSTLAFYGHYGTGNIPIVRNVKIEKGNMATDWTPAPEDVQVQIDASVKSVDVQYYLSTSETELDGGSWSTTAPEWADGHYMWSRTVTTLQDGTVSYKPSENGTCIATAQNVDQEFAEIRETIETTSTRMVEDSTAITMEALKSYTEKSAFENYQLEQAAKMELDASQIQMRFEETTAQINKVDGDTQSKFTEIYKNITFSEEGITLGSGDSSIMLVVDNDMISFRKNGVQFGWWDGVDFHTGNIVVEVNERAQFGNFAFVPRSDGSLMFLKVGG